MKQLLKAALLAMATSVAAQAQTIMYNGQTGGTMGALDYNNDYLGATYPYYVQFGVSGTTSNALDTNPENLLLGGTPGVTVSSITAANDSYSVTGEQTQTTSGITFDYSNATSPVNSNTSIGGSPASVYSVQTSYDTTTGTSSATGQSLNFTITFAQAFSAVTFNLIQNDYASISTTYYTLTDPITGPQTVSQSDPLGFAASSINANDNYWQNVSLTNVAAGDTVTVSKVLTSDGGAGVPYSNVSISGISFTTLTPAIDIPEPATYAILGLGFDGLVFLARRRLA